MPSTSSLTLRLMETMAPLAVGTPAEIDAASSAEVELIRRWCEGTGNSVVAVHPHHVEVLRGRASDPIEALRPDRRPGHRLWVYTNFNCNLACDYCCVSSSPRAAPRVIPIEEFCRLVDAAVGSGVAELYLTGGEPTLLNDLAERLEHAVAALPTVVLTNAMLLRGERLRRLAHLPCDNLILQISLDSATPDLHDRHRGDGSHARTMAGIATAIERGFRVRVAATLGDDAADAERELDVLLDGFGLLPEQRLVRRVARQGSAHAGLVLSRRSLIPEVCVTAEGVWWHPVAAIDPAMRVSDDWKPFDEVVDSIRDEYRSHRLRGDVLASSFPCA